MQKNGQDRAQPPSRQIVVGDVHGCLSELEQLLTRVRPRADDQLVFLGDLVDKGPQSEYVVRFIREMSEKVPIVLVEGNHEEKHKRWRNTATVDPARASALIGASEMAQIELRLSIEDRLFLERSKLWHPLLFRKGLITHGGILPKLDRLPDEYSLPSMNRGKAKRISEQMQRVRFLSEHGDFLHPDLATSNSPLWAESYDGRFGWVIFGHHPFTKSAEPVRFPHAIGIDLGCVYGGSLCALIMSNGGFDYEVVRSTMRRESD